MGKTINLATKYADKVMERFYQESITQSSFAKDLDAEFTGVKGVKVYEVNTAPMNNYQRSGSNRYGNPEELGDSVQEYIMTQDRSFTYTIDKGNNMEQLGIKAAGKSANRQLCEVVTPEIDTYRLKKWAAGAGQGVALAAAPTAGTIYGLLLDAKIALDNKHVPTTGRTVYLSSIGMKALLSCPEYISLDKLGSKSVVKGKIGEILGMDVKYVPDVYMPSYVYFMVIYKDAAISPVKLHEFKIHTDAVGVSGWVVEGRYIYDAFVKGTKMDGIYVAATSGNKVTDPTVKIASGSATVTVATGATGYYTLDGSDPRYSATAVQYTGAVPVAAGEKIRVVAKKDDAVMSGIVEAVGTAAT